MNVKDLRDYKKNLTQSLNKNLEEFEKNFILISGALFAFSITFIKDIIDIDKAQMLPLLFTSWLLMALAMALMMWAFLYAANSGSELWQIVDKFIIKNKLYDDTSDLTAEQNHEIKTEIDKKFTSVKKNLKHQRYAAVLLFLAGIIAFAVFVSGNLYNENNKPPKPEKQETEIYIIGNNKTLQNADTVTIIKKKP